jgi:hypothetical protein
MANSPQPIANKQMRVGLGEALQRLLRVEARLMNGFAAVEEEDLAQRQLILDALNLTQLDLGFDCDDDDVPDTVDIFEKAAQTSCCRIVPDAPKPKKARGKSRAATEEKAPPLLEVVLPTPEPAPPVVAASPEPVPGEAATPSKKPSKKSKGFFGTLFGSSDE